jgi:hypothetical protein
MGILIDYISDLMYPETFANHNAANNPLLKTPGSNYHALTLLEPKHNQIRQKAWTN